MGVSFFKLSAPEIVSGVSGESEAKLRRIFDDAATHSPALIFIDEIDAVTPKRGTASREMERRIVSQLLTCLDGNSLLLYDTNLDRNDIREERRQACNGNWSYESSRFPRSSTKTYTLLFQRQSLYIQGLEGLIEKLVWVFLTRQRE